MNQAKAEQLRQIVHDNYQQIAHQFAASRQKLFWPELRQIIAELPLKGDLLDVGCGTGRLLEELKTRPLDSYTGLDLSTELLAIADRQYPNGSLPFSISWQAGDLLDQAINRQFDTVCCIAALHHIPGPAYRRQAVTKLAAWLKPNGSLIISVWDLWSQPKYWFKLIASRMLSVFGQIDNGDLLFNWGKQKKPGSQRYYHAFTQHELKKLITSTALNVIDCRHDGLNYYLIAKKSAKS